MKLNRFAVITALFIGLAFSSITGLAQQRPQGGQGGRGNFDPAQFQERMMERFKEQLGASDAEWKVMGPMISGIMEKQRDVRGGGFMGRGGFGGRPGGGRPGGDDNGNGGRGRGGAGGDTDSVMAALQAALDAPSTPAAEIQAKLKAVREDRAKKQAELEKAQAQLKQICTARQEALLVVMGMLQ